MDRALFDAVQQKLTDQWTTRSTTRNASDHLLTGLLFDDAGHRMVPTHADQGRRSLSLLRFAASPSWRIQNRICRIGLPYSGDRNRRRHRQITPASILSLRRNSRPPAARESWTAKLLQDSIARIDVHEDHLAIRLKSADGEETSDSTDDQLLSIPWQKPPSRRSRQILLPHGIPRNEVRPTRIERRARLVSAIARGRRWLDEIVSGSVTDVQQIASTSKMQRAPGQHDDLARVPRTRSRARRGRRSFAARHWRRATS